MEPGPQFKVSSERLVERKIEPLNIVLQGQHANHCATTAPWEYRASERRHEKTCLRWFEPDKTQTGLLSYRGLLESWKFEFSKYRYYTIWEANNKGSHLRSLICTLLFAYGINRFSHGLAQWCVVVFFFISVLEYVWVLVEWLWSMERNLLKENNLRK